MKKLDNKLLKEKEGEQQHFDVPADTTITCDCCSKLPPVYQPIGCKYKVPNKGQNHQ